MTAANNLFTTEYIKPLISHPYAQSRDKLRSAFSEMQTRITQISRLYKWSSNIESDLTDPTKIKIEDLNYALESFESLQILEIHVESFYLFSFRWIDLTRFVVSKNCLSCSNFVRAPESIIKIRNALIIHPERSDTNLFTLSFGVGSGEGATVRSARAGDGSEDHVYRDRGFQENAREMSNFIRDWCVECLKHLESLQK